MNDLWGGRAVEFFGADRLEIPDDLSYDPSDTITVEVWVRADAWASRATNLRKSGSFILYNYSGRLLLVHLRARLPPAARHRGRARHRRLGPSSAPTTRTAAPTTSGSG